MSIYLAKSAGFCFGVNRAIDFVYDRVGSGKVYTYGPIIHNKEVIKDLENNGVYVIDNFDEVDGEVIIRSHGVPPMVYDELEKKGIRYSDCTCPFVKKIHKIVSESYEKGEQIIIIGNPDHPEVIGINGWSDNSAIIINSIEDAENTVLEQDKKYCLVVQTTFQLQNFNKIIEFFKNFDIKINNTICSATSDRQKEADEISKNVDLMVVLGDKSSSNTQKLYEICKNNCKNTFLCETIKDLELKLLEKSVKIGITAGASTPPTIIKEAIKTMSEFENKSFADMIDETLVSLHTGDIIKGTVIAVSNGEVSVNLGYKSDGIIPRDEYSEDINADPAKELNVGDVIEVFVVRVNDGEGNVLLSKKRIDAVKGYEELENAFNNKTTIKGTVVEVVKGGLVAAINGSRAFVPSSQISHRYVEDLSVFKGQTFDFNIIELDRSKNRIVAGRRDLAKKEYEDKKNAVLEGLNIGDRVDGTVSRIVPFGAFVDLGGIDGLIHVSELSWGRVNKVKDVLNEGDKVKVTVLDVNKEKGKISLSLKDIENDPWKDVETKYAVGSIIEGTVVRMVPFGAFVELEVGVDGLVHISQIANKHVKTPEDELTIGQTISAKVMEIDMENKKISLSIKETLPKEEVAQEETTVEEAPVDEEETVVEE